MVTNLCQIYMSRPPHSPHSSTFYFLRDMPPKIAPVVPSTSEHLERAAHALREGRLVGMPTETVYGMAGDALNPAALAGIFEIKRRPFFDPLIVHIERHEDLDALIRTRPEGADLLMKTFWPGPLTLVLPKSDRVPDLATAGLGTVAVRMPAHPVARALLRATGRPLAAPSANPFGSLSPTTAAHVADAFADDTTGLLACVLDGGACEVGVESTVVGWDDEGLPLLLRAGGVPLEALEAALGRPLGTPPPQVDSPHGPVASPGALPWHYAPRTPLYLTPQPRNAPEGDTEPAGLLWFGAAKPPAGYAAVENLSPTGDLREAAANLFAALHRLDSRGLVRIDAHLVPESGLGRAINERLAKAAAKTEG
jgi:L-threonylcarbamoyladenylate synthase